MDITDVIFQMKGRRETHIKRFSEALAIPSVSALQQHKSDMLRMARWLTVQMEDMGLEHAEVMPTPNNPIVYGDWLHAPGAPTVLVYGHYDVQPTTRFPNGCLPPFSRRFAVIIFTRGAPRI